METSAKNSTNVEQAFMAMAAEIKNRYIVCVLFFSSLYCKEGRINYSCI